MSPHRLAVLALCLLAAKTAAATEHLTLEGGFLPDPHTAMVTVSGTVPAAEWVRGCPGHVPEKPSLAVALTAPGAPLRLLQSGNALSALVVASPDGAHHCASADGNRLAALRIEPAQAGTYYIWPATAVPGVAVEASLLFSERSETATELFARGATANQPLATDVTPAFGALVPGETLEIQLSGSAPASIHGDDCAGEIDPRRPDATLTLNPAAPQLVLTAAGGDDTTLLVVTPTGQIFCNDDSVGLDPRLTISPAPTGRYAIWVGHWGAETGNPATLAAARDDSGAPDAASPGATPYADSPFRGRDIPTAMAALDILLEDPVAARSLRFARRTPLGADGFVLHAVTLAPETGDVPPMRLRSLRVTDLDLHGLSAAGAPGHFRLTASGIDYETVAQAMQDQGALRLPGLNGPGTLSFDMRLLPPLGDETRRDLAATLTLEGQLGLGLSTRLLWPDEPGLPAELERLPAESITVELTNLGYVGLALRSFGGAMGLGPSEAGDLLLGGLSQVLAPVFPGSPKARLLDVLAAVKREPDGRGVLRMAMTAQVPRPVEQLMDALKAADGDTPDGMTLDFAYDPMP